MSECCGGGKCCGNSQAPGIDRRDFLKAAAASAGGLALLGGRAYADDATALKAWTQDLWKRGERRVYRGPELEHIAVPLGGVGAGQVYLTGRGRLDSWQIVNNFKTDAHAPGAMFGLWTRTANGQTAARLLQEGESDGVPGMGAVEFTVEYPFAWLRYIDEQVPVEVSLEAYTPLIPLEADESGLPLALFRFSVSNKSNAPVEAAVMTTAPNLVGWDGYAPLTDTRHGDYIANANTLETTESGPLLKLQTRPGTPAKFAEHRDVYTDDAEAGSWLRFCGNTKVHLNKVPAADKPVAPAVMWVRRIDPNAADAVRGGLDALRRGVPMISAGDADGLVACAAATDSDQSAIVFEDWEKGYGNWTLEGDCFGAAPATDTLPAQGAVSGWRGKSYVNSYVGGDDSTGRAVSKPFTVEKRYVHLQIGGGKHPGETCLNFVVDGKPARSATGENTERLRVERWDVADLQGKTATIEIVDSRQGGWGHVLVGDIVFSDSPQSPFLDAELAAACREALPFRFKGLRVVDTPVALRAGSPLLEGVHNPAVQTGTRLALDGFELKDGARVLLEAEDGTPLIVAGKHGEGTVLVCLGPILDWFEPADRRTVMGRIIAEASNVAFAPQTGWAPESIVYGSMALGALPSPEVEWTARPQWDDATALWDDFAQDGRLDAGAAEPSAPGRTWNGALSGAMRLESGETRQVTFALAWHFPNRARDNHYGWGFRFPEALQYDFRLGNRYNNRFKDAAEVLAYAAKNLERLEGGTRLFHETFYNSTLPQWLLDGVTANIANIRSPIFVWLEDGTFGGFEGADACCPMNCTHVYNYAMSTAYVFPELERNVRETDVLVQMNLEKHYIPHRTVLPLSEPRLQNDIGGPQHHALDGELGTLLKACREWRLTGDRDWLAKLWPNMRKVMEHVLRDHDKAGDGVFRGEQPNTYDTHLYGSNTFVGALYLATLRAMEEMAKAMNEPDFAAVCRDRFDKGSAGYDKTCWNGEYYENIFDAPGVNPDVYNQNNCYGPACFSDQLLGQWWAWILDLGEVLPAEHVKTALQSTYKYNWRSDLSNHVHNQRVFAEGKEKGLLVGSWPRGGRPERPILYCDEVWTGIEYHVAASLIWTGMVEEGLQVAKSARDRYTGEQRNPLAEVECGHHYARALSSFSLLNALSGFQYDGAARRMTLAPRITPENFRCFFSADRGWGALSRKDSDGAPQYAVEVSRGSVRVARLRVPASDATTATVTVAGKSVPAQLTVDGAFCEVSFDAVALSEGQAIVVGLGKA